VEIDCTIVRVKSFKRLKDNCRLNSYKLNDSLNDYGGDDEIKFKSQSSHKRVRDNLFTT